MQYVEVAQGALLDMESERLRNSLLAAISHDLRTPLTSLVGLFESLALSSPRLSALQLDMQWQSLEEVVGSALRVRALLLT